MRKPGLIHRSIKGVMRGLWAPIERRINLRLQPIEGRLQRIEEGLLDCEKNLRATDNNLGGLNAEIGKLWHRVEFLRKEIFYELKYGGKAEPTASAIAPRIIEPHKVAEAQGKGIRLNLGCGHVPLDGYVNVDKRELPGVDIVADVGNLPFEPESVAEIFSAHVLEHFPQERLRRLLPYWRSLLQPKGVLRAIVPDGEAMLAGVGDGSYPFDHFREVLFGAQEYDGDFHFNLLTPDSLSRLLLDAGLQEIEVPAKARKNDICFEFEIVARRA